MKWLFVLLIFHVNDGPRLRVTKVFASQIQCNSLGKQIEREFDYQDPNLRSFSMCIPEDAYDETKMQVDRFGGGQETGKQ
jgi:hypothetical protein